MLMLVVFVIVILLILVFTFSNDDINNDTTYVSKPFLTNNEYNFLVKFKDLENEIHVNIVPKVNLASVIKKVSNSHYNTELFRNIDFGIFNADYSKLLLLIELNDESHNKYHRKKRDIKVNDICKKAGVKLITFYTKYPNEKEYVKERILKELDTQVNNN